jgi:hypothetical protein
MPTSSQSKILSVVDYQLLQQSQQQSTDHEGITIKQSSQVLVNQTSVRRSRDARRSSIGRKDDEEEEKQSTSPVHRRSSTKMNESKA